MTNYEAGKYLLCGGYSSYTPTGSGYFKQQKRYGKQPHVGDVIYFYTSSLGRISHTGIVSSWEYRNGAYTIETIEGNTAAGTVFERDGGCVAVKKYNVTPAQIGGGNRIDGFGTPKFCADTCSAEQFVAIARSQVGYVEKASNRDLDQPKANPGDKNWTKYGAWYGLNPAQWCQMFVSWCAYMACVCAHEYKPGWTQQDNGAWNYVKEDGSFAADEWLYLGGRWYAFKGDGEMVTGWFKSQDDWYYLADDGGMCSSQWVMDDGKAYYLTASGAMAKNAYVRAEKPVAPGVYIYYWVDDKGVYQCDWDTAQPHLELYEEAK